MSLGLKGLLVELASRAWAGCNSAIAQQEPSWRSSYVPVLLLLGFVPSHLKAINYSLQSLLPRIVPGLWPFYEDASPNGAHASALSVEKRTESNTIPNWLDDMLCGVSDMQRFDFQVWRLTASDLRSDRLGVNIIDSTIQLMPTSALMPLFSVLLTYGLTIYILSIGDRIGFLSLGLLCAFTSIGSFARLARPILPPPTHRTVNEVRPARIAIYTEKDALVIIHTTRDLAGLILSGLAPEPVFQTGIRRWLHFVSLFPYTFGLVLLADATPETQVAFAAVYVIIASLSLLRPVYPPPIRLEIHREYIPGCGNAAKYKEELRGREAFPSYVRTLWYALYVTQAAGWPRRLGIRTGDYLAWYDWLREALKNAEKGNINWPAVHELDRINRGGDTGASAIVYGTRRPSEDEDEDEAVDQGREGNDQITPVPVENW